MEDEEKMVNVRMKGPDLVNLDRLCKQDMRTQSNMLRWLISQECERRFGRTDSALQALYRSSWTMKR